MYTPLTLTLIVGRSQEAFMAPVELNRRPVRYFWIHHHLNRFSIFEFILNDIAVSRFYSLQSLFSQTSWFSLEKNRKNNMNMNTTKNTVKNLLLNSTNPNPNWRGDLYERDLERPTVSRPTMQRQGNQDFQSSSFSAPNQVFSLTNLLRSIDFDIDSVKSENVLNRAGNICVRPSYEHMRSASMDWINCCMGLTDVGVDAFDFEVVKNDGLSIYEEVGLINMYKHHDGFIVFKFKDDYSVGRAIKYNSLLINGIEFFLSKWVEYSPLPDSSCVTQVWVRLAKIPFLYWNVESLCTLSCSLGKPLAMSTKTYDAAVRRNPQDEALILIEMGVQDPRPSFILTALCSHIDLARAQVNFQYLSSVPCSRCFSEKHAPGASCPVLMGKFTKNARRMLEGTIFSEPEPTHSESSHYRDFFSVVDGHEDELNALDALHAFSEENEAHSQYMGLIEDMDDARIVAAANTGNWGRWPNTHNANSRVETWEASHHGVVHRRRMY